MKKWFYSLISIGWLALVTTVMAVILDYSNSPGPSGATPQQWPAHTRISRAAAGPTLLMFAHPRCPCTRSSVGELALLMARCQGRVNAQVWFLQPPGVAADWAQTDLWRAASAIPGVTVHADLGGEEAKIFHSETSGLTALYDADGQLVFQGGITLSRGHSGDNPGRSALAAWLENRSEKISLRPVFGCPLFETQFRSGDAPRQ